MDWEKVSIQLAEQMRKALVLNTANHAKKTAKLQPVATLLSKSPPTQPISWYF